MGLFKSMKDMKQMVNAAPALVQSAQVAQRQAFELSSQLAAQTDSQTISSATGLAGTPEGSTDLLAPIAGVSLDQYAEVSRGLAAYGYDTSKAVVIAASIGISADDWATATDGWTVRMTAHPHVAREFNRLYTGR